MVTEPVPSALPATDLARYHGDTAALALRLVQPDTLQAFNPTGSVLLWTLKRRHADTDAEALVQKISTVGGIAVTDAAAGAITVSLVPADYAELLRGGTYVWDVQAQNQVTGAVLTVATGRLFLAKDVTRLPTLSIPTTTTNPAPGYTWDSITGRPPLLYPRPDLDGLTGGGATKLDGVDTSAFVAGVTLLLSYGRVSQFFQAFASDEPTDLESTPIVIRPVAFHGLVWVQL